MAPQIPLPSSSSSSSLHSTEDAAAPAGDSTTLEQGENTAETTGMSTCPRACNNILTVQQRRMRPSSPLKHTRQAFLVRITRLEPRDKILTVHQRDVSSTPARRRFTHRLLIRSSYRWASVAAISTATIEASPSSSTLARSMNWSTTSTSARRWRATHLSGSPTVTLCDSRQENWTL